jgi:KDO2-lipid IV(A) lauroyltransferase
MTQTTRISGARATIRGWKRKVVTILVAAALWLARRLPPGADAWLARGLAALVRGMAPPLRRRMRDNLRHVYGAQGSAASPRRPSSSGDLIFNVHEPEPTDAVPPCASAVPAARRRDACTTTWPSWRETAGCGVSAPPPRRGGTTLDRLEAAVWDTLGTSVAQWLRLAQWKPADVRRGARIRGMATLRRALAAERGAILLSGHVGCFELGAAALAARGVALTALVRTHDEPALEALLAGVRARHGVRALPKQSFRAAIAELKAGRCVALLADQAVRTGGVPTTFLGRRAATAVGPLLLAHWSGAPILPLFVQADEGGRPVLEIHAPLALPADGDRETWLAAGAQVMNDVYGQVIARAPERWLWLHRRWKKPDSWRRGHEVEPCTAPC